MFESSTLITFSIAALIIIVIPGPAVLFIITQSIESGRNAGLISVSGILTGGFIHVITASLGVAAIFAASPLAFNLLKFLGAAYLIFLGISTFRNKRSGKSKGIIYKKNNTHIYRQGVWVNLLNPKAALFLLAFLPQFTDPSKGLLSLQIFILGILFITFAAISDAAYALLAAQIGLWLKSHPNSGIFQKYFSACIYILLGFFAAFY